MTIDYAQLAESVLNNSTNIKVPVTGDSMSPVLRTGDTIYVEPVKAVDLSVGDILVYKTEGNMVAHRLVRILSKHGRCMFLTKGDTFSHVDNPLKESDLIGRVYAAEKLGMKLHMRKGIFSIVNRLSYLLSPLSSFLYRLRRKQKGFDAAYDTGIKSNEELFITSLLKDEFSDEKMNGKFAVLLKECSDLSLVQKLARDNGMSNMLYTVLKRLNDNNALKFKTEGELNFLNALRNDYLHTAAKNTLLYSEFGRVAASLRDEKIDALAMKGAALAELVYQDIGARSMSDIDLLIKKMDLAGTDAVFRSLGYTAVDASPFDSIENPNNYLTTRDYRSSNPSHPSFHLHWHIVNSSVPAPYSSGIDINDIWKDAVPVDIAGVKVLSMSPHHFLIHLAEHAMRVTHSASKLVYLTDVAALIKRYGNKLDWNKTVRASKDYGIDIFVRNILKLTELNTEVDIPEWVLRSLKPEKRTLMERLFFYMTARGHGVSGLSYLVHLGMNKGLLKKASIISRTLFPPAWVLAKRHPGSVGKSPLKFYLYRVKEVLSSVLLLPVRRLRKICLVLLLCMPVLAASPANASGPVPDMAEGKRNSTYTMEAGIPEYLIAPDDVLEIRIWRGFEEKKHEVTVKPDGSIFVAYVSIKASNKTARQAEAELRKALLEYIREPRVEIMVKEYRGRTVTLLGAVQSQIRQPTGPGIYSIKGKTNLSRLIIIAGGFAKEAELRNVRITSLDGIIKKVNLFAIMFAGDISKDIVVDGGDVIYVPYKAETEEYSIFILGEVNKPGIYKLTPDLTVLQSLVKAGGYKKEAMLEEIRIIRGGLENPQLIVADTRAIIERGDIAKNVFLQNKDIIYIPKTRIGDWNAFLAKLRPTLEFLTLPFTSITNIQSTSGN
jgi:polysaccharide export outer membrane protein